MSRDRLSRRFNKETKEKELRRMYLRLSEIWKIRRNAIALPLEKPIFAGYKKVHIVRDDITRSPWGKVAAELLSVFGNTIYSRRKDFLTIDYKNCKSWRSKSKKMVEIPHNLKELSNWEWEKVKDKLSPAAQAYISKIDRPTTYGANLKYFCCARSWWFDSKISRHMLTHYTELPTSLISEEKKLNDKLSEENFWAKTWGSSPKDLRGLFKYPTKQEIKDMLREQANEFELEKLHQPPNV